MKRTAFAAISLIWVAVTSFAAGETRFDLDSNTAFYEGEAISYVIKPLPRFRLVTHEAKFDGYSFAFVPDSTVYDSAGIIIGVHIYKTRGMAFDRALADDTGSIRKYYGENLMINPVESVYNELGAELTTFYLNIRKQFIPNVMISYFDGGTELIIFELVISPDVIRVTAEEAFMETLRHFKTLKKGDLSSR
jgi:hypothetical protein